MELPNFVEFLVGRLDLGSRDRLLQMRHPRDGASGEENVQTILDQISAKVTVGAR